MPQRAGIVLVGNEILSGKVIDANAAYLCRELRALGVDVRRIAVIPDDVEEIAREVAAFSRAFDVVFTSGGVGPTHDDVTIEGVARALGVGVVRHPTLVAALERYYRERLGADATLGEPHLKMAEVPEGAELLADGNVRFPTIRMGNVYILPGRARDLSPEVRRHPRPLSRSALSPPPGLRQRRRERAGALPQRPPGRLSLLSCWARIRSSRIPSTASRSPWSRGTPPISRAR